LALDAEAFRATCATSAHSGYDVARLQLPLAACVDPRHLGARPHQHRSVMATLTRCDPPLQLDGRTSPTFISPNSEDLDCPPDRC
jgi:hypothetical protein